MKKQCCVFLLACITFCIASDEDELKSVVVVFRHGDRTPISTYPNDPYKDPSFWPVGPGQLTNIGKQQAYDLGVWLKNRYNKFLPTEHLSNDTIYVRSSDLDRTVLSAGALLAGLFPANRQDTYWQPVAIHTVPVLLDEVIKRGRPCLRYDMLLNNLLESDDFKNASDTNENFYKYLSKNTGQVISSHLNLTNLYDVLSVEEFYNFTLPKWTKSVYPSKLTSCAVLNELLHTYNIKLARLQVGPLFREITKYLKTDETPSSIKFALFSSHDTNLISILNSLKVFDFKMPAYSSAIIFESRQSHNGTKYINLYYKNKTKLDKPVLLKLPKCELDCNIETFFDLVKPFIIMPEQWEEECQICSFL